MSKDEADNLEDQAQPICPVCGSLMTEEDGSVFCTHCDGEIDYFGDDENDGDTE